MTVKRVGNFNWPPEMEAAYQKWLDDNDDGRGCLCLTCLQVRLRRARPAMAPPTPDTEGEGT